MDTMFCGSLVVATAPRVSASASTSSAFSGKHAGPKNDAVLHHSIHPVSAAVHGGCKAVKRRKPLRWVAAPGRGLPGSNRADTRLGVLYEPSRADASSDERDDLVVFVAREQGTSRRASASSHHSSTSPSGAAGKKSIIESFRKSAGGGGGGGVGVGGGGGGVGSPAASAAAASKAAREARAAMSAMRRAEAQALADRMAQERSAGAIWEETAATSSAPASSSSSATNRRRVENDDAASETMETPRSPRPTTRRAAADALAKVNLGKTTTTTTNGVAAASDAELKTKKQQPPPPPPQHQQRPRANSSVSSAPPLKAKPVDAATAAAVLGLPSLSKKKAAAAAGAANTASGKKVSSSSSSSSKAASSSSPSSLSSTVHAHVPAPTGSGAHKDDWNSFVDWKMMEHQDYQTIPDEQFETLSTKLHIKEKWRPMVSYLVSLGLTTKELEKVLVNCEELFKRPVAKILTRVEYLQNELGFESEDLRKLINKEPQILLQRNRHSVPRCRFLTEVGVPAQNLSTLLRKQPQILHLSVEKGLKPRVAYFKNELLIADAEIPKLIERNPAVLTFSIENQIKPRVEFLKDLGISHEGVIKMIVRHPHLLQYSFEGLEEHINFLSSIGMNEEDMVLTVTRLSQLFSLSVANSLRPKFEYLTEELGGTVQTCVKFPAYFSLSLDQRIRPRHTYLQRFSCAPDPFPMKYLSESDTAFAARASKSLEEFVEYKEHVVPLFKEETERQKARAEERSMLEQRQSRQREVRTEQERRLMVKNQGYSQRIIDARNSMRRVKASLAR